MENETKTTVETTIETVDTGAAGEETVTMTQTELDKKIQSETDKVRTKYLLLRENLIVMMPHIIIC